MTETSGVEQLRDQVLQLAREIEQFSNSALGPEDFFSEFLRRLVAALGASAGAVWLLDENKQLQLTSGIRFSQTNIPASQQAQFINRQLLSDVISTGETCLYSHDDNSGQKLPSEHLVVVGALQSGEDCVGAVEIFQRADAPREARPGYLQFVEQMCGYASQYLSRRSDQTSVEAPENFWERFEQFALQLQRCRNLKEVGAVTVHDGRLLLPCDRLSLAVRRGSKTEIVAISGQESVNPRSNLVRAMAELAEVAVTMGESVRFAGKIENLAPQVEKPLATFVQEAGSRLVLVVPLTEDRPFDRSSDDDDTGKSREKRLRTTGALVIEQLSGSRPVPQLQQRAELLSDHVAASLSHALEYQRVILLPVWRYLGSLGEWLHGRKLAKVLLAVGAVLLVTAALMLIPWDYRVEGEGRLMPVRQREVFAPWDAEVVNILVEGGQRVDKGQPLIELRNDEQQAALLAARNELAEKRQLVVALQAQIDDAVSTASREEEIRLESEFVKTQVEIRGLTEQIQILEQREDMLTVKAPIAGVVATFQPDQFLRNRPVQRGEILLEVMDETGPWRLELEVEEHRVGHILRAQQDSETERLPVEFVLATSAESTFDGRLDAIATRSAASEELGTVVEVFVATDVENLPHPRIGSEVRAKINCGKRSLGYVLFGDVIEFVRKHFWL